MAELHINALVIGTDTFFNSQSELLATLALRYSVPAMYQYREFAAAGGLVDKVAGESVAAAAASGDAEATALLHGREAANTAAEPARQTFEQGAIAESLPTVEVSRGELEAGAGVLGLFVKAGLVASNGEARRQIKGGGLRVNDTAVTDEKMVLTPSNLTPEGVIKLSMGKKKHVLLKPT